MAFIGEFSLKYYNQNLYKDETLDSLPSLIEKLEQDVRETKKLIEPGVFYPSYDHYADAKAFHYQACERLLVAKKTYKKQLSTCIANMQEIINNNPDFKACLEQPLQTFKNLLENS